MNAFLMCFSAGGCLLWSFLLFFSPWGQNLKANRWLAVFFFLMGISFLEISFGEWAERFTQIRIGLNSFQFIMAPSLFLSTVSFVNPNKSFGRKDLLHFLPFLIFLVIVLLGFPSSTNPMVIKIFSIGSTDFLLRDLLPLQLAVYIILSYLVLIHHKRNLRILKTSASETNYSWLGYFLLVLTFVLFFWINDALIGQTLMLKAMPIAYTSAVFFLASYSIKQHHTLEFNTKQLIENPSLLEISPYEPPKKKARLNKAELSELSVELNKLMHEENIFLDNELSLPILANRLGISVHDASYMIREVTGNNFYNYINSQRIEQSKRLLASGKTERLNMVGIAFASGFNSKTAFNTAFKKFTGMSPTEYTRNILKR
ncbi:AraC family transcriptional regulator [Chryseobacterium sp. OSA05B]|uniref:helix-turn-helix domain-containing protein n=1 Tax=Chryseobacterium sp. OSA05B TaxID=2862650 RepID=UPI001CBD851D|nr:helix-turn-helix domain-containing protein [Chryseobacterium sp. OSA05B]